jgi:transcription-repair coupling factor (superfamily II helicase)
MTTYSPTQPPKPPDPGSRVSWDNLHQGAVALATARAAEAFSGLTLVVTNSTAAAQSWRDELGFYAGSDPASEEHPEVLHFPDWETLAYDGFSPHQDIISERLATLHRLPSLQRGILVVSVQTLLQRIMPRAYLDAYSLSLRVGQSYQVDSERKRLTAAGYAAVEVVTTHGEYAVRGSLLDIFPMGAADPVRVDLLDDEIDSLRTFDPESQRTIERIEHISMLPAKEYPFDADAVARFRNQWHETFNVDVRRCGVYQDVSTGIQPSGIEYYLPLFYPELGSLFDYLPSATLVIREAGLAETETGFLTDVANRYENLRHDIERPILEPHQLFLREDELHAGLKRHGQIVINGSAELKHGQTFRSSRMPDVQANPRHKNSAEALTDFLGKVATPPLFVADTAGRREVFNEFLLRAGIHTHVVDDLRDFLTREPEAGISLAQMASGLWIDELCIITESQVFGHQVAERRARSARSLDPEQIIKNLTELHIGDPVVHITHGVGRYQGLTTLEIDGATNEFLALEYAEEAKLYVPVTSLHLISRYSGAEVDHAPLNRLGSDAWDKAKKKAAERIHDVAAELLNIYARRESSPSHQFAPPTDEYRRFSEQFPFEVTPDQQRAIDEVIADLASERATDRLICGDVGFGKTEVAMRAAFLAVQGGKQVVVLVPTTLLAQQHFDTFRDRFADWPLQIEVISRMRSEGEVAAIAQRIESGKVDIIIGTHKLLNSQLQFADLGLVIVDEEHRFGVRQKERLRDLRAEVDLLTLTATPIPRTLNMAMSGMRDLSIIATPPAKRLSIKTFVQEKRNPVIKEAITRELMRGGQVFYLHNEVRTISQMADELTELVPEARIGIGHGQMPKRQLEQVMNDFYHRQLNLLVCTTIIETGIDIPNANTIIIERADKFGLAQLHQLRGRVGRSHRQAYAYLLTPHRKALTKDAVKRLEAIEAAGELGVGFTLATHDLEIRGAGELLGDEQSGQIESIGFSLYMQLLDRAVSAIKQGKTENLDQSLEPISQEVNLHTATLIPETYLPDVHGRLILYKRIASAASETELEDLRAEVIDRFGRLPESVQQLFALTTLKLKLQPMGILRLDLGTTGGRVEFSPQTTVDPLAVVKLVQAQPATYQLDGAAMLRVKRSLEGFDQRLEFANQLITELAPAESTRMAASA